MAFPHSTFTLSIRTLVVGALVLTSVLLASIAIALHYSPERLGQVVYYSVPIKLSIKGLKKKKENMDPLARV